MAERKPLFDFQYGFDVLRGNAEPAAPPAAAPDDQLRGLESTTPESFDAAPAPAAPTPTAAANQRSVMIITFLIVVGGIIAHWVWEALIAGLNGGDINIGTPAMIVARVVISFIAGMFSFVGIWRQLEGVDPSLRLFTAFTQGFAVDALSSPIVTAVADPNSIPPG